MLDVSALTKLFQYLASLSGVSQGAPAFLSRLPLPGWQQPHKIFIAF